jgi:hypothetical protein
MTVAALILSLDTPLHLMLQDLWRSTLVLIAGMLPGNVHPPNRHHSLTKCEQMLVGAQVDHAVDDGG